MVTVDFIKTEYPLHWLVWNNDYKNLEAELAKREQAKEKRDVRGRTPLMLAVTLGHLESVRALLNHDANVNCENSDGWTVLQEAVATGDPELLQVVLERRDYQRYSNRTAGVPELLQQLKRAPDFYVEMKWEFTSWVPLVSRMCPSDTYKVYKQGSNVRIDTTLLGFDHSNWQRGSRSYIFKGSSDGAVMMEIDHDLKQVFCEQMRVPGNNLGGGALVPSEESISQRLTTPIVTTYIDTDKISFERNKAGVWGWRSDKTEVINSYECKVFSATNVELVTKTRTEHLTEVDKANARNKNTKTALQNFLGIAQVDDEDEGEGAGNNKSGGSPVDREPVGLGENAADDDDDDSNSRRRFSLNNPCNILPEEYFDEAASLEGRDIGRPKEINTRVQKFKATLWLSEQYPLSFPEQILPIVDLMAMSSSHFAKLKNFIQMQLPSGFPVKIEIPLFHVLNARITFGNIFAIDSQVPFITRIQEEEDSRLTCVLDECIFEIPSGYTQIGADGRRNQFGTEDEDELLQFAIQQSLIDAGTEKEEVDIWEALRGQRPSRPSTPNSVVGEEERQLQKAIQASLALYHHHHQDADQQETTNSSPDTDSELHMALMLSEQQRLHDEQQRLQEQKMLEEVLRLSLTENDKFFHLLPELTFTMLKGPGLFKIIKANRRYVRAVCSSRQANYTPIYKLPFIHVLGVIGRLKVYQTALASIAIPGSMILKELGYCSNGAIVSAVALGLCGCATLYSTGLLTNKFVGFVYLNEKEDKIKVAYLDFWGRRRDCEIETKDVVPFSENASAPTDRFYLKLRRFSAKGSFKISVDHGVVLDADKFNKVFS